VFEPVSAANRLRFRETEFRGPEIALRKTPAGPHQALQRPNRADESPANSAPFARPREIFGNTRLHGGGCSPDRTSLYPQISLLTGKRAGNFAEPSHPLQFRCPIGERFQWRGAKFPTQWNREFFWREQGIFGKGQRILEFSNFPGFRFRILGSPQPGAPSGYDWEMHSLGLSRGESTTTCWRRPEAELVRDMAPMAQDAT
jgi:hypothetical protein